jgi:hypothetical protein
MDCYHTFCIIRGITPGKELIKVLGELLVFREPGKFERR